jgi:hypothetical protein
VVNLQIKSGTNQLPGQRLRVQSRRQVRRQQLLQQPRRARQADFKQNQFGGTVGGPVFKDQPSSSRRIRAPGEPGADVPLDRADRGDAHGDFSELNRSSSIRSPGQPFPGNVIPSGRIDTVAKNILSQLYPEPNTAGSRQATDRSSTTT